MEDCSPGEKELLRAIDELCRGGRGILAAAREESGGAKAQEFVSLKIGRLAGLIQLYANFYNNLNVRRRGDAEDLFKRFYHSAAMRDQMEDLLRFELEWNNFLGDVDNQIKADSFQTQLKLGTQVPGCLKLTDVRSGREVQLEDFLHGQEKLLLVLLRHFA
ncbi:selenoprotein L [Rhinoraja longicauda]